jgi:hypothetical protein
MWKHALSCAILAPGAAVKAAIFALPEPTFVSPAVDGWNPAPTEAPRFGAIELLRRDDEPWKPFEQGGTCGFFDGIQSAHLLYSNFNLHMLTSQQHQLTPAVNLNSNARPTRTTATMDAVTPISPPNYVRS